MQPFCRRSILFACAVVMFAGSAFADTYPSHPVKIVVPFPAGGSNDIVARVIAQKLSERNNGQTFLVENRGGAGGNIGAEAVATSDPDGYTLLLTAPPSLTINAALYKDMSLRSQGLCAGRADRRGADRAGGAPVARRQQRQGIDCARQGEAGHALFRIVGQRFDQSSRRRIATSMTEHRSGTSLTGGCAGDERSGRRPHSHDVRQHPGGAGASEGQDHQRDRGRRRQTRQRPARRAHGRGVRRARLRSLGLVRTGGAGENTRSRCLPS